MTTPPGGSRGSKVLCFVVVALVPDFVLVPEPEPDSESESLLVCRPVLYSVVMGPPFFVVVAAVVVASSSSLALLVGFAVVFSVGVGTGASEDAAMDRMSVDARSGTRLDEPQ